MAEKKVSTQKRVKEAVKSVKMKITKTVKKVVRKEKQTRIEILQTLAENTSLTRTDVEKVFDNLALLMESHLRKNGSGEFTIPKTGVKLLRYKKPPRKERRMVSPLIGEEVVISAKPARWAVKFTVLKPLKDMVE
jgi:nucleoid DNA-binding protein